MESLRGGYFPGHTIFGHMFSGANVFSGGIFPLPENSHIPRGGTDHPKKEAVLAGKSELLLVLNEEDQKRFSLLNLVKYYKE